MWVAFGAILTLAFVLRVVALDHGLWGDQITVYQLAQLDAKHLYTNMMSRKEVHPPLTYFLLHGWLRVGSSEAWARGLFVLFGVGTCAVTFGLGRALAGRRFGLMAMAAAAVLPSAVWASRFLRSYIIGAFFAGLAAWSFIRLLQGKRSFWDWALYGAFSVLAVQTFYFNALLLTAQGLYGLAVGWRRRGWVGPLVLVQGLALASLIPLILPTINVLQTAWVERIPPP